MIHAIVQQIINACNPIHRIYDMYIYVVETPKCLSAYNQLICPLHLSSTKVSNKVSVMRARCGRMMKTPQIFQHIRTSSCDKPQSEQSKERLKI